MKIQFKRIRFNKYSLPMIDICNEIISKYQDQGMRLTLRQLYYQLVVQNVVPNAEKSYNHLSSLISKASFKCGEKKAIAHHKDYSKPLKIEWLCFYCHNLEHGFI